MLHILTSARCGYHPSNCTRIVDATVNQFREGMEKFIQSVEEDSIAFFYFSSHGHFDLSKMQHYLVFKDSRINTLDESGVNGEEFRGMIQRLKARKKFVILDCCFAGGLGVEMPKSIIPLSEEFYKQLMAGSGCLWMCSSAPWEPSYTGKRNSLFTSVLLEGLRGKAAEEGTEIIDALQLVEFTALVVMLLSKGTQTPVWKPEGLSDGPFPICFNIGETVFSSALLSLPSC